MDWSWAGPPLDVHPQFPAERAELLALLGHFDPADWQRDTVCPGWRVHDVAAHLVHDYLRKLSGRRDAAGGRGPRPGEDLAPWLHRMNQEFVDVAARWSPRVLIDLLGHLGPQLDDLWAALDLTALGEAVSWAAPGRAPVWLDVARGYSDYSGAPAADPRRGGAARGQLRRACRSGDRHVAAGRPVRPPVRPGPAGRLRPDRDQRPGGWQLGGDASRGRVVDPAGTGRRPGRDDNGRTRCGGSPPAASPYRPRLSGHRIDGARELALAALGLVSIIR